MRCYSAVHAQHVLSPSAVVHSTMLPSVSGRQTNCGVAATSCAMAAFSVGWSTFGTKGAAKWRVDVSESAAEMPRQKTTEKSSKCALERQAEPKPRSALATGASMTY